MSRRSSRILLTTERVRTGRSGFCVRVRTFFSHEKSAYRQRADRTGSRLGAAELPFGRGVVPDRHAAGGASWRDGGSCLRRGAPDIGSCLLACARRHAKPFSERIGCRNVVLRRRRRRRARFCRSRKWTLRRGVVAGCDSSRGDGHLVCRLPAAPFRETISFGIQIMQRRFSMIARIAAAALGAVLGYGAV